MQEKVSIISSKDDTRSTLLMQTHYSLLSALPPWPLLNLSKYTSCTICKAIESCNSNQFRARHKYYEAWHELKSCLIKSSIPEVNSVPLPLSGNASTAGCKTECQQRAISDAVFKPKHDVMNYVNNHSPLDKSIES